ncbi:bifunctional [glutamate--ammonia ligase]-adenylyl-L-tyrosine phosphorylase/[glutamate--ammonia-ligase] adenylyltransferase [Ferrimonas marina]|uniref:Bifunctional glutamine synthetase adenylyltransferase/adenylyl-removing enzyme n=1 Tax=Ferrimonas marina TaxID=299255 RepID=A0A1M5ZGC1_9GAMM|nr:bifunctional [glutamate--ammonia ligase]-adenylyl-L-tyrosine phosphorylase/[glutamate--ammonia-ligase] adenylyltransferase [Ferrimonas marina]SHI22953.1 glutamate-ammonia-ligase adenylyltransferase [Ferrimonas marina]
MNSLATESKLSPSLQQQAQRLQERLDSELLEALAAPERSALQAVLALSEFAGQVLARDPALLQHLFVDKALYQAERAQGYDAALSQLLGQCADEASASATLRRFRNAEMCHIAARDLLGLASLDESLHHLSRLAEACIGATRDFLVTLQAPQWGRPFSAEGQEQSLMILGMGKLGGGELNFSSDIDLIFCYPEHGQTQGGRRELDNQQYFIRLGQKLINLLSQTTVEGFCYRVDMRLRPFGEAGPLVISMAAMEDYYQEQGREWERYAMVKARLMAPLAGQQAQLDQLLRPFVYRRYLDYSAIDALRRMKQLIETQLRRQAVADNIKLGPGGIREVEFVVQSHQLIRGGREPGLRGPALLPALAELDRLGLISHVDRQALESGYRLLREVENRLQAQGDKQTQRLPDDESDRLRLALAMGYDSAEALWQGIAEAMAGIHRVFRDTVGDAPGEEQDLGPLPLLWQDDSGTLDGPQLLEEQGLDPELWPRLQQARAEFAKRRIGPRGRETLDKLVPYLLQELARQGQSLMLWTRLESVLTPILTRTTYLELLLEKEGARRQLITLCAASPWITEQLARYPILLDELIDPVALYQPLPADGYGAELREFMLRVPEEDLEQQMEALRQFKQAQQLRIAAADVTRVLPVMKVSDHLSWLAEAIVEKAVDLAWQQISQRHGVPAGLEQDQRGFAVIAYGKLGGLELGYGSDLDLVFLHQGLAGETNGPKPIDNGHFYIKLAQRILHLFATRTPSGVLYEVDMRLRPSGSSGLLVSPIEGFERYQQEDAWTWEHQALVRARCIYGDDALAGRFGRLRRQVLCRSRDPAELREQVVTMRAKMRDHLDKGNAERFDMKQGLGGITDIEFITQYLVLAYAREASSLATWSDNVRILESALMADKLEPNQADLLIQTYIDLRNTNHHRVLAGDSGPIPMAERPQRCDAVAQLWQELLLSEG